MVENNEMELSEAEAEQYDRQIRLWGLESQKRLRASKVLVIGLSGLGAEIAKNIILSGVKSVCLLDNEKLRETDQYSQFLAPPDKIGENRAEASLLRARALNPMVDVTSEKKAVDDLPDNFFTEFDIVCATGLKQEQLERINNACRDCNKKFLCGDVWGMFGYMFTDLVDHEYSEEIVQHKAVKRGPDDSEKNARETVTITVKRRAIYVPLQNALSAYSIYIHRYFFNTYFLYNPIRSEATTSIIKICLLLLQIVSNLFVAGKSVVWEQACALLEKRFTNSGPRRVPTVLLVDELDALCNRRQDVLYSIMEWAAHNTAQLTVLAVANTMDLPERALAARVASRLGLTRLPFPPYTHTQLQCIVATKLAGANVTPDAVQLIARKVAAVSGDARRAIALCTRALELAEGQAGLPEVQKALNEAASSATVRAIGFCSQAEKLMLRAVAAEVERTGSDETTLSKALATAAAIVALDGRPYRCATSIRAPTPAQAQAICARLAALKLLLLEPKPSEPRLLLNISTSDVYYATKCNIRMDA